ncbi:hypothetical protein [Amycolatopsis magusensis]|uniref:Uncharacterized protein n=1 Tax=Amycolatopsis magusensis TaxID=882444 RepID=A0ABS4PTZ2_9PSEU|nr:hypothetical protein [Amycolatopsis magusensis]MBP2182907.1 hypothetical protein [Amycolatopsis magusensis]
MRFKLFTSLLVVLISASGILAPVALASDAKIRRQIWLATRAGDYGGYTTLLQYDREIILAEGNYSWKHEWTEIAPYGYAENERVIYLKAGTYFWNCYVTPRPNDSWAYNTACYMRLAGHGNAYTTIIRIVPHPTESNGHVYGSWYFWESNLTRV